jgi:transcriptional regulator with XRE-family HTH domain
MADWKRRAKAAAALAGMTEAELAKQIGISIATYNRRLGGGETRLHQMETEALARAIAGECGVPFEFFTADFRLLEVDQVAEQLARVQDALAATPPARQAAAEPGPAVADPAAAVAATEPPQPAQGQTGRAAAPTRSEDQAR